MATVPARVRTGDFTYDDFCAIVQDGQKADLIDGVIYMASPDNTRADDLFGWLFTVLKIYVRRKKLGRLTGSRVAYRLDDKSAPEPDIGFVRKVGLSRIKRGGVEGSPDLAIEIVSPDSIERDYITKRKKYEQAGVSEYWIVDEQEHKVTVLRPDATGKFREVRPRKGVFHSQVITGFRLDPSWLWQDPLPDEMDTVQRLLGGTE
jgi:Uma2 family endonuclease